MSHDAHETSFTIYFSPKNHEDTFFNYFRMSIESHIWFDFGSTSYPSFDVAVHPNKPNSRMPSNSQMTDLGRWTSSGQINIDDVDKRPYQLTYWEIHFWWEKSPFVPEYSVYQFQPKSKNIHTLYWQLIFFSFFRFSWLNPHQPGQHTSSIKRSATSSITKYTRVSNEYATAIYSYDVPLCTSPTPCTHV